MKKTITFMGLEIQDTSYEKMMDVISLWLKETSFKHIITVNPEIIIDAQKNNTDILKNADVLVPDGMGLLMAIRLIKKIKLNRIAGIDLTTHLFQQEKFSFYLIGSTANTMQKAGTVLKNKYSKSKIMACHDGYFDKKKEEILIEDIIQKKPDIVLVGTGFPKQEQFLAKLKSSANHGIGIGVGGSFDVISGDIPRAPKWIQRVGFEWLFRVMIDPKRISRLVFIPRFIQACLSSKS